MPRQRQIKLGAASSLGQPRAASASWQRCSGRLYRHTGYTGYTGLASHIGTAASWTSRLALLAMSGEAGRLPPFELLDKPLGQLWFA